MALTNDHFKRISAFVHARLDDVFTSIYNGQGDRTNEERMLRALRRTVSSLTATGGYVEENKQRHQLAILIAWNDLHAIAKEWDDHPDYHPDFAKTSDDMADVPAPAVAPEG